MIVITVARKPVEGTVSGNVLKHGTGALNINGTRLRLSDGEAVHAPQSDPAKRAGVVGKDLGFSGNTAEQMKTAQQESIERTNLLGRWPANVIFEHKPECRRVGTQKIKAFGPVTPKAANRVVDQRDGYGFSNTPFGYGDAEGEEAIEAWACREGCPVADLDVQSGVTTSGVSKTHHEGYSGVSATPFMRGFSSPANQHGGTGGASRFFKCVGGKKG